MFPVLRNDLIAPSLHRLVVKAPEIAEKCKAGQFVLARNRAGDKRIPLTIGDADSEQGTISLFVQTISASTQMIVTVPVGSFFTEVTGPLGLPTEIEKWGRVVCVSSGVGTAVLYPMAKALVAAGNEVTTIIGGRTSSLIILAAELSEFCHAVHITTSDGSIGTKGLVTNELDTLIRNPESRPCRVFAAGPVPMMREVSELTHYHDLPTVVSLNPIMIDGTSIYGGCQVQIGTEMKFTGVDGPEFNGHLVDFDSLSKPSTMYKTHEEVCHQYGI